MSKRMTDRERLLFKLNRLNDSEVRDLLAYLSGLERKSREPRGVADGTDDELLAMLSASYECRRARQVFEWEAARRKAELSGSLGGTRYAQR